MTPKTPFHFVLEATGLFRESKTKGCVSCPRVLPESPRPAAADEPLPCAGSPRRAAPFSTRPEEIAPSPGIVNLRILTARENKCYLFRLSGVFKKSVLEAGIYEKKRKIAPAAGGSRGLQRAPSSAALPCEGTRPKLPLPTLISLFDSFFLTVHGREKKIPMQP